MGWEGGTPSADNWGRRLALDLRYVDLIRETGTDILWDDAGWYDKWGTWNGPDWQSNQRLSFASTICDGCCGIPLFSRLRNRKLRNSIPTG